MRLGLFGGTFDPPHIGHLIVAQDALSALALDHILFIPAGAPPHKRNRGVSEAADRLAMLERALHGDARFGIDALELERSGPSYTIDTVAVMRERQPDAELFLLIGADQFAEFATWREPERLAKLARIAVLSRDGEATVPPESLRTFGAEWVPVTRIDVSSTDIRRRCAAGESIRYRVPRAVEDFLDIHHIYERP